MITDNGVGNPKGAGIALFGGSEPVAKDNVINYNVIIRNKGYGGVGSVAGKNNDVTKNWWGSTTGPKAETNPCGIGDEIRLGLKHVLYRPWCADDECKIMIEACGPPEVFDEAVETKQDQSIEITLTALPNLTFADGYIGDPSDYIGGLHYEIVDGPEHGELIYGSGELPVLLYKPKLGWFGEDHFTFKASCGLCESEGLGRVTIKVLEPEQEVFKFFFPLVLH